jgi:sortase (surface protein transpeptidase)
VHTYVVREKKTVPAADLTSYQNDGEGEELILYTCWPPDSISQRYLVIADPV